MAGITLAQAEEKLQIWMDADDAVATGKSYAIGNRSLSRADAVTIRDNINYWQKQVDRLTRGGIRITRATPL